MRKFCCAALTAAAATTFLVAVNQGVALADGGSPQGPTCDDLQQAQREDAQSMKGFVDALVGGGNNTDAVIGAACGKS
jgi:hypothetical protein